MVYESSLVILARWHAIWGQVITVRTPIIDTVGSIGAQGILMVRLTSSNFFRSVPWDPTLVISLGFFWGLVGALVLRKCR